MSHFKVLLVYPNLQMINLMPSNIALLSANLKKAGIHVRVFDTTLYRTAEKSVDDIRVEHLQLRPFNLKDKGVDYKANNVYSDFVNTVEEYNPDLIGISATDDTYDLGINLISRIEKKRAHVIVGGVYPTFAPDEVIDNSNIDSICIGEGEEALVELCTALRDCRSITSIKNLWVKSNGKVHKNDLRSPVNINEMPIEDFDVFEPARFFRPMQGKAYRMIPVSADRGCPYACQFCAAPSQRMLYSYYGYRNYFRIKSVRRIMDELEYHTKKYKADYIYFNSETFFARKQDEMFENFAKEYARKVGLPFWCQTTVETITDRRAGILKDMNCDRVNIGVEHGNEEFRKNVLRKVFTNNQVIKAFRILEKNRIPVTVNNIIGFPDETRELAFDTIRLNRHIQSDSINVFFFVPYQGTSLRLYCIEKGYIASNAKSGGLVGSSILNMPWFTSEQISGLVRTFPLYVKMPESYYARIKEAERLDKEGNAVFEELRTIYFSRYFK